ncbi:type II toxin-antitoxin system RelE/ParE family toxin [Thiotrichales bacterium HSG1]|nr:type II toxin-antitoxin system RelE/ParE family toxin [Thiotrichales bacterium HSG1]
MALYNIEWKHSTQKEIKKLPKVFIKKIIIAIEKLAENPFPKNSRKITGTENTYRIRVGTLFIIIMLILLNFIPTLLCLGLPIILF